MMMYDEELDTFMMCEDFDTSTPSPPPPPQPLRQSSSSPATGSKCYKCKEEGHWARDCPKNNLKNYNLNSINVPIVNCRCGAGPCNIIVSKTEKHPGWKFYACPNPSDPTCKFFMWFHDVKAPMCRCNAGACSVNTMKDGPHAKRLYYACRVPKGHGACPFFEWVLK